MGSESPFTWAVEIISHREREEKKSRRDKPYDGRAGKTPVLPRRAPFLPLAFFFPFLPSHRDPSCYMVPYAGAPSAVRSAPRRGGPGPGTDTLPLWLLC